MNLPISLYNFVNIILTGFVFCLVSLFIVCDNNLEKTLEQLGFIKTNIPFNSILGFIVFILCYEIGLIINRIGSVVIEGLLIKIKFIEFTRNYKIYTENSSKFPIIEVLSREYALSRTQLTLYVMLCCVFLFCRNYIAFLVGIFLSLLFLFSCYKHIKKIHELTIDTDFNEEEYNLGER